jgi:uncharacterized protein with HEPN domain
MQENDLVRLRHMLDSGREAASYAQGHQRTDLEHDRMLLHALVRCIEIIGEAASGVSAECRTQIPAIPWSDIVGMRNRLIHAYFDIDLDLVWNTVEEDLPPLIGELEKVVPALE